jgi:hypothetical protein
MLSLAYWLYMLLETLGLESLCNHQAGHWATFWLMLPKLMCIPE